MLAALGAAAVSGLVSSTATAQVARRREDDDAPPPLLVAATNAAPPIQIAHGSHRSHSSHSSHSSHRSHYSSSGGGGYSSGNDDTAVMPQTVAPPPPPPPKPARVSFVAYPGGRIFVNGNAAGTDSTDAMVLKPGSYQIRIENRFVGNHTATVEIAEGQTGVVTLDW